MKLPFLQVLEPAELAAIDQASRTLLEQTGFSVRDPRLLGQLQELGLEVDHGGCRVRISSGQVERALQSCPRHIAIHDRQGRPAFVLGPGQAPRFAAGFNATFTLDEPGGNRRPALKADVAQYARLAHRLSEIDVVGPQAVPHDVPAPAATLHAVSAVLENTTKPVLFAPNDERDTEALIEILRVVTGKEEVGREPIGICQFSPSSPLFWSDGALAGFLRIVREGFPCTILPGPLAGATSPYTLAGNLVQKNAEVLAAVTIAQALRRGAPLLCYSAGGQFDMRSQTAVFGSPEVALILMAGTQLARHYGLPAHACFPSSDSHCLDEQLAIENTLQLTCCLFSGADLMVNAGMFAGGETACPAQMVIDSDIWAALRRMARGLSVDSEHLCPEAFGRVQPMGSFLDDPTTIAHLRSGEWSEARLLGRRRHEQWRQAGAATATERASRLAQELGGPQQSLLEGEARSRIDQIIAGFEAEHS